MRSLVFLFAFAPVALAEPTAEAIEVKVKGGLLKGTLLVPPAEKAIPVVFIHAGSGPTDRDGNQPVQIKTDGLKMLAEGLAAKGIASLRIDKRAIGASIKPRTEEELSIDLYAADVAKWVEELRIDKRFSTVTFIGHSEGAMIGLVATQTVKFDNFVSLCGPGKTFGDTLRDQLKKGLPKDRFEETNKIIAELEAGRTVKDVPKDLAILFRPSVQPFLISAFKADPVKLVGKLAIPVLVVQGTVDLQVPTEHGQRLADANKSAKLVTVDKMNHTLKKVESDKDQAAAYTDPKRPLATGLVDAIGGFVLGR